MKIHKDIFYANTENPEQSLDLYLPESEEFSLFVYFHGGGIEWDNKKTDVELAKDLTDKNIAFITAEYRKYPYASYPDFIKDAAAAVAWAFRNIEKYGKCDKIYVGGSSAGAYLSMMLCFDPRYLAPFRISPSDIAGYVHNAGQPTVHFNVLRERGVDTRRIVVDEAAPLYHIGNETKYPPMQFIVADEDIESRYEELMLTISTIKRFAKDTSIYLKQMPGKHCKYGHETDEEGVNKLSRIVREFIKECEGKA